MQQAWARLVDHLAELGTARDVVGGIAVTVSGSMVPTRTVNVVVTPGEWSDFLGTMYGTSDPARTRIQQQVLALPGGLPFLVYDGAYGWVPSDSRHLPDGDDHDLGPGEWSTTDRAGNVTRFADWKEPG